jgi:hypothetical protein
MMRFGLSECEQERVWKLWGTGLALRAVARKLGAVRLDAPVLFTPAAEGRLRVGLAG